MKLLHLSDLHLGKRVNEFPMLADQQEILRQILALCDARRPDAVLIAGDIYDRALPSAEAVELLDDFLTALAARRLPTVMISGNHDSAERLRYGGRIFAENGIHIITCLQDAPPLTLHDEYGAVHFYALPFVRPAEVRCRYPEEEIVTYEDGVRVALRQMPLDAGARNVLLSHQFYAAAGSEPLRSDSETVSVGGLDCVSAAVLEPFDYVALGHLHRPQHVGREGVRYGGSPLKYSFSECLQPKGATWVELREKGSLCTQLLPLTPLHDMREIRGSLAALTDPAVVAGGDPADYLHVILTDEDEIIDAIGKLRAVYPNLMRLDYDNARTRLSPQQGMMALGEQKSPLALFRDFYAQQNGVPLTPEKEQLIQTIFEQTGGFSL